MLRTLGDGKLHLQNNVMGTNQHIWSTTLVRNQWQRFVYRTRLEPNNTGWIELWYQGVRQTFINGQQRYMCPSHEDEPGTYNRLKWGIYRSGAGTGNWHAWMSRARIGTTFADVDPDGGTGTPTPTPGPRATPTPGTGFSGYYRLTARHSGKTVVVQSASTSNSANVFQWTYGGASTNDEWQILGIGSGYYRIINRNSGKDLTVASASTADGANIFQYTYGGTATNDEWAIVDVGSGYHRVTNRNSGKSAEVAAGSTTDGANVDQRTYSGATYQQFHIVSVP